MKLWAQFFARFTLEKEWKKTDAFRIRNRVTNQNDVKKFFILVKYRKKKHDTFQDTHQWIRTWKMDRNGKWRNQELSKIIGIRDPDSGWYYINDIIQLDSVNIRPTHIYYPGSKILTLKVVFLAQWRQWFLILIRRYVKNILIYFMVILRGRTKLSDWKIKEGSHFSVDNKSMKVWNQ